MDLTCGEEDKGGGERDALMLKWASILSVAGMASAVVVMSPVQERIAAIAMALMVLFLAGAASFAIAHVKAGWAEEPDGRRSTGSRRGESAVGSEGSQTFHPH